MKHHAGNERIKRKYFRFLSDSEGRDEATIDVVAKALARFESFSARRDFKSFHFEQAVAFKRRLADTRNARNGEKLSKATQHSTLRALRDFFRWLSRESGYKAKIAYSDASYFNLTRKDVAIADARREKTLATLAQIEHVLSIMPSGTLIERRNRALVAFATLTGTRASALASIRLGDVNIGEAQVYQDARHVRTKFAKSFQTDFLPFSGLAMGIVRDWHAELSAEPHRGHHSPLFPATAMDLDERGAFRPSGLKLNGWKTSSPVRDIFKKAFAMAKLPYFQPHSFRTTLTRHAMTLDLRPETCKAVSQALGHNDVMTTFTSYGHVPANRQSELIRKLPDWRAQKANSSD